MIQLPQSQINTKVVSVIIPRDVQADARALVERAGISLSSYVTALLRADLAARRTPAPEVRAA
jgi:hypothetical protein